MTIYEAYLFRALELNSQRPSDIRVKRVGGITYISLPEQAALLECCGLWHTNGYDQTTSLDGERIAESNGWRYLRIEESGRNHGVVLDETNKTICIQRMQAKALRTGLLRCRKLSELVLSYLSGRMIPLSPEQIRECSQYALEHATVGLKARKRLLSQQNER